MTNTKKRHKEILAAATEVLENVGGVGIIDALPQEERRPILVKMAKSVQETTNCAAPSARNNVAKAMRKARFKIMKEQDPDRWGGARVSDKLGRPRLPEDQKRERVSTRLGHGVKELAQAIAEVLELDGWGHAVDQALVRMVEGDRELKIKLAEIGIILKKQN